MSANKAFYKWHTNYDLYIKHQSGCSYESWGAPINECRCDCYELAIFRAGYFAAKGIIDKEV